MISSLISEIRKENDYLRALLKEVADSGVSHEIPDVYVEIQLEYDTWKEIQELFK